MDPSKKPQENESSRRAADAELVRAAQRGNKRAFVEIVARHQAMVSGIALGIIGDFAASEDVGQEVFLTAWRKIHDLREATSIEADLVVVELAVPLPPRIESALLTIAQESLSNVRRHAQATIVIVTLQVTNEQAILVVQDNGIGLSQQVLQSYRHNTTHLGLKGMHHRLGELGGQFALVNGEEGGLIVKAVVPL